MPIQRILIATDFSTPSERAVECGFELARQLHAEVCLLYVHGLSALPDSASLFSGASQAVRDQALEDLKRLGRTYGHGVITSELVRNGDAPTLIVDTAHALVVDLVVLGSRGRGGLARALLGSVTDAVLRRARCPVLVVPPESARRGRA